MKYGALPLRNLQILRLRPFGFISEFQKPGRHTAAQHKIFNQRFQRDGIFLCRRTKGQNSLGRLRSKGQQDKFKILPWDGPGRDFDILPRDGLGWAWMGYCQRDIASMSCLVQSRHGTRHGTEVKKKPKKKYKFSKQSFFYSCPYCGTKGQLDKKIFLSRIKRTTIRRLSRPLETLLSTNSNAAGHSTLTSFNDIG